MLLPDFSPRGNAASHRRELKKSYYFLSLDLLITYEKVIFATIEHLSFVDYLSFA